jgi:hypothetical protein
MVILPEEGRCFQANGAVTESRALGAPSHDTNMLRHHRFVSPQGIIQTGILKGYANRILYDIDLHDGLAPPGEK